MKRTNRCVFSCRKTAIHTFQVHTAGLEHSILWHLKWVSQTLSFDCITHFILLRGKVWNFRKPIILITHHFLFHHFGTSLPEHSFLSVLPLNPLTHFHKLYPRYKNYTSNGLAQEAIFRLFRNNFSETKAPAGKRIIVQRGGVLFND